MDDDEAWKNVIKAIVDKHGVKAVQAFVKGLGRPPGRPRAKWSDERLMTLWVLVQTKAYARETAPSKQKKINTALKALFADRQQWRKFFDLIDPEPEPRVTGTGLPWTEPVLLEITDDLDKRQIRQSYSVSPWVDNPKQVADLYYQAGRLMKKWKQSGDKRYARWMRSLDMAKKIIDGKWTVTIK